MPLFLKSEPTPSLPGLTLYSDPLLGTWSKTTGIYVPPSVDIDTGMVNVLLWLHGYFVRNIEGLFNNDASKTRQQVYSSGKSIVLIAPFLEYARQGASASYHKNIADMTGRWGEVYLNQALNALAPMRDPKKSQRPEQGLNSPLTGLGQTANLRPPLRLGKLIIACHSGGGSGMRNLVSALGQYKGNLAECWGFDCLYGEKATPDDAKFWYGWATGEDGRPLHIHYGSSTVPQSVKLALMGQGLVTETGARREPEGAEVSRINVKLGVTAAKHIDDLMGLDQLLSATTPKGGKVPPQGGKFAEQAAHNVSKNVNWPKDLMKMHYEIASEGLLERLKGADFL